MAGAPARRPVSVCVRRPTRCSRVSTSGWVPAAPGCCACPPNWRRSRPRSATPTRPHGGSIRRSPATRADGPARRDPRSSRSHPHALRPGVRRPRGRGLDARRLRALPRRRQRTQWDRRGRARPRLPAPRRAVRGAWGRAPRTTVLRRLRRAVAGCRRRAPAGRRGGAAAHPAPPGHDGLTRDCRMPRRCRDRTIPPRNNPWHARRHLPRAEPSTSLTPTA